MPFRSTWRPLVALFFLLSLPLVVGCGGKSGSGSGTDATQITVSGKVTYTRIPLLKDASGRPTGLETDPSKFVTSPARGVAVRAVKYTEETMPDGTKVKIWDETSGYSYTDSTGAYSIVVPKDTPVFMELLTLFAGGSSTRIVGDAAGIDSTTHITERPVYSYRKGLDGSSPDGNPTPTTKSLTPVTVDFAIGLTDKWWLCPQSVTAVEKAVRETTGTGSRVLAIGDSLYAYTQVYGTPTPPGALQLHYRPGVSHPRGTFVEYDLRVYQALSSSTYFASIRGGADNDDAFDQGVLMPLFARNGLYNQAKISLPPVGVHLADASPDVALLEGLPDAMAGVLLKSPYLADTTRNGIVVRDIHDLASIPAAERTPYSGRNLAALTWELMFKAQGLNLPGTSTDWDKLDATILNRFLGLIRPVNSTDSWVYDIPSIYSQLARLQEDKTATETVDLKTVFTDATLTSMLEPFGVTWPRPTSGPFAPFMQNWGADPNTLATPLPTVFMSMAGAVKVDGVYRNLSHVEVANFRMNLTKDTPYNLRVVSSIGALPAGVHLELSIDSEQPMEFTGAETVPVRKVMAANTTDNPQHYLRLRLISPNTLVPDFTATIRLDLAP